MPILSKDSPHDGLPVKTAVEKLAAAIGYPERISGGGGSSVLRVDGMEIVAEETDRRIRLSYALTDDEALLPTLAAYAAGRMLKEEAVLSYGDSRAFLWQDGPADADAHAMLRLFETFMDSCDWWRARVEALRGNAEVAASVPETMMIRP